MKYTESLQECREHGTFYFPFEYYECTIPESFVNLSMHWHEEMELCMVLEGECIYHIDLNSYKVQAGDLVIIAPHMLHGVSRIGTCSMKSDSFVFSLNMLGYEYPDQCTVKYLHPIFSQSLRLPVVMTGEVPWVGRLADTFREMKECYLGREDGYELELKSGLFSFFGQLCRYTETKSQVIDKERGEVMEKIKAILNYIHLHYQNPISISELAEVSHFSEYHFMRFFKKNVDMTCVEYLNNYRLQKALGDLENSGKTVTEIALENGFNSIPYFNRLFKRRFQVTPGEYRKIYQGEG